VADTPVGSLNLCFFLEKLRVFLKRSKTSIDGHQLNSKFFWCTVNTARLQRKSDKREEEKLCSSKLFSQ